MFGNLFSKNKKDSVSTEEIDANDASDDAVSSSDQKISGSEEAAKKRNSLIIRIVVVLGITYFGVTEFVLKEDPVEQPAIVAQPITRRKKVNKPVVNVDNNVETKESPVSNQETANQEKPTQTETQPPIENIVIANKETEVTSNPATDKTKEEVKTEEKKDNLEIVKSEEQRPNLSIGEVKTEEKKIDQELDRLIDSDGKKDPMNSAPVELKDKISVEDSYVDPPSYEDVGRGLVYNCKEKFWVCVDKPSYVACNKNMKYNKAHNKKPECAIFNVYNSNEDCSLMQKHNVSTVQSTDFCN